MGASGFHLVGHLVLASATLEQAIELVRRAVPRVNEAAPALQPLGNGRLGLGVASISRYAHLGARVEAQFSAVLLHDAALHFLDSRYGAPAVRFAFPEPADARPYLQAFPGGVAFNQARTCIVVQQAALRRRAGSDPLLLAQLFTLALDRFGGSRQGESWRSRVRRALRAQSAPRLLNVETLAERLSVSPRSLSRRLAAEGTTFSVLVDEVLYERAQLLLSRPSTTLAQVADALGYAELSSFCRAFRRWSGGHTPSAFRPHGDSGEPER